MKAIAFPPEKISVYPALLSNLGSDRQLLADGVALPMASLTSYIKTHKSGLLTKYFDIDRLVLRRESEWPYYLEQAQKTLPSVWLFSSYVWSHPDNIMMAEKIKLQNPNTLIIFGGPHVPAFEVENKAFFKKHPFIDITVRAEGEVTLACILEAIIQNNGHFQGLNLSQVNGISFRKEDDVIRTQDRERTRDLSIFPSPYLSGELDDPSFNNLVGMVLETNRGCPFGCTYCDWGSATLQKISHFDLDRIKKEIEYIATKKPVSLRIADANFGAFKRDVEITKKVIEVYNKTGYPKEFSYNLAKNASTNVAEVITLVSQSTINSHGALSIQTTDIDTLNVVKRQNIKNKSHEKLIDIYKELNLQLTSEVLIGLPGQTYEAHTKDMQYLFDRKITTSIYNVQMMPNAPMNEPSYREKYKIKTNELGYITSTSTFTKEQLNSMHEFGLSFQFFYMLGVLKYFLYFLQVDYGIKSMSLIKALWAACSKLPERYPISTKIRRDLISKEDFRQKGVLKLLWQSEDAEFLFSHLDDFYNEIFRFSEAEYGIQFLDSEKETIIAVQKSVMPIIGKEIPLETSFPHDYLSYFKQIKNIRDINDIPEGQALMPLRSFLPGSIKVRGLKKKTISSLTLLIDNTQTGKGWELRSSLMFDKALTKQKPNISPTETLT